MSNLMENIKNLREITGAGFLDCKNALAENNNDIESSADSLRKKGLIKASKKSNREAKEGAIGIYTNENFTTIIQINTETDFAAKNDVFLSFMDEIGKFSLNNDCLNMSIDNFNKYVVNEKTIVDHFKDMISKIGENIILSKLLFIEHEENSLISTYIHNPYKKNIGKIAVTLKTKIANINDEARKFGKNLCMHIAASKPLSINIDELDKDFIEKEKSLLIETIKISGKPDNIIDKILEGKMKKFYSEITFLNQKYILDPDKSVEEAINDCSKQNKFEVVSFNLVVLGS